MKISFTGNLILCLKIAGHLYLGIRSIVKNDGNRRLRVALQTIRFKNYNKNIFINTRVGKILSHTKHMTDTLSYLSSIFFLEGLFRITLRLYLFWLRAIATIMTEAIAVVAFNLRNIFGINHFLFGGSYGCILGCSIF